jgi:hypothetical protein
MTSYTFAGVRQIFSLTGAGKLTIRVGFET